MVPCTGYSFFCFVRYNTKPYHSVSNHCLLSACLQGFVKPSHAALCHNKCILSPMIRRLRTGRNLTMPTVPKIKNELGTLRQDTRPTCFDTLDASKKYAVWEQISIHQDARAIKACLQFARSRFLKEHKPREPWTKYAMFYPGITRPVAFLRQSTESKNVEFKNLLALFGPKAWDLVMITTEISLAVLC